MYIIKIVTLQFTCVLHISHFQIHSRSVPEMWFKSCAQAVHITRSDQETLKQTTESDNFLFKYLPSYLPTISSKANKSDHVTKRKENNLQSYYFFLKNN